MKFSRRGFLSGFGSVLAAVAAAPLMPAPLAKFIETHRPRMWSEIVNVTIRNRSAALANQVTRNNALLQRLSKSV